MWTRSIPCASAAMGEFRDVGRHHSAHVAAAGQAPSPARRI
jgi:hypothetical protein